MNNIPPFPSSDDEDLEALRLAALQSLRRAPDADGFSHQFAHPSIQFTAPEHVPQYWSTKGFRGKRGKFFSGGLHQGRGGKNFQGHFNNFNRIRTSNLISITTVSDESSPQDKGTKSGPLNAPLDGPADSSSKFNRYDKSDRSESESELEEVSSSEADSPAKLERSDSLEALMQELDDEIQGKKKEGKEGKPKTRRVKKKKGISEPETKDKSESTEPQIPGGHDRLNVVEEPRESPESTCQKIRPSQQGIFYGKRRFRSRSPGNRGFHNCRRPRNFPGPPTPPVLVSYAPPPMQYHPQALPFPDPQFVMYVPQVNPPSQLPPPYFDRPLSPLAINADSLTMAAMAPLSPRSAAFVLENKAIVERRKRSPRRSYSRSPSRSPRRSLTPRRSPRRSLSPRRSPRRLPPRKRSLSPRRKSLSPSRRSVSPKRRVVEKSGDAANKTPIRDRLGAKAKAEETKDKLKVAEDPVKKDDKPVDPVLEARKRKFETNEIKMKEGIIRLRPKEEKVEKPGDEKAVSGEKPKEEKAMGCEKPKEEKAVGEKPKDERSKEQQQQKPKEEKLKESIVEVAPATTTVEEKPCQDFSSDPDEFKELERLLNDDLGNEGDEVELSKVDDIFSDEDSASDNEGRFKVKEQNDAKPPILSYSRLVNGTKSTKIDRELLPNRTKCRGDRHQRERDRRKIRSHTPPQRPRDVAKQEEKKKKADSPERTLIRHRINLRAERRPPPMDKKFERKIEIKIKNPSKYERSGKSKSAKSDEGVPSKVERKFSVRDRKDSKEKEEEEEEELEAEVVMENESEEECSDLTEGDLRAQLSKKRAEKLHRGPVEAVHSRLLQYALQGAFKKKSKKKTKDKEILGGDVKLPIHLRLGLASSSEVFSEGRSKRKSRKRKNREVLEQV